MSEAISIREFSRRMGVSDTAVHKAVKAGRVSLSSQRTTGGRPLIDWPSARDKWVANSDTSKRSHVGSQGGRDRLGESPVINLPTSDRQDEGPATARPLSPPPDEFSADGPKSGRGPGYAQARAVRETFMAQLARLDFQQKTGKLVDADEVKVAWFKHISAAKTRIMGIPAACKSRYGDLPLAVVAVIEDVCRQALEDLANGSGT